MATDIKYGDFSFRTSGLNVPSISIETNLALTDAGALLGGTLDITLQGKLIATGSAPLNDNTNYTPSQMSSKGLTQTAWSSLIDQMKAIESNFSQDYKKLDIRCNNNIVWNFYQIDPESTKVNKIEFNNQTDEQWMNVVDYTIQLQVETTGATDYIPALSTPQYVSSIENSYNITPIDTISYYMSNPTSVAEAFSNQFSGNYYPYATGNMYPGYTITRRLSAIGKATKPKQGSTTKTTSLQNAKAFVTGLLYYDRSIYDILNNLTIYDRSTVIDASDIDGRYSITDTFTAYSGTPLQDFTETFDINNSVDTNLHRTTTIKGTIKGLKVVQSNNADLYWNIYDNNLSDKYLFPTYNEDSLLAYRNASGFLDRFMVQKIPYNRCLSAILPSGGFINAYRLSLANSNSPLFNNFSGWLNPTPINVNIEHNISEASIDYTFTFDSRPLNLIPGAFNENIDVKDEFATRQYANQTVYYRMPLTQDLGTYSLPSRTVTYSASFIPQGNFDPLNTIIKTRINETLDQFNPNKLNPASIPLSQIGYYYYYSWIRDQSENFDPIRGTFSKNITWNYELRYWGIGD